MDGEFQVYGGYRDLYRKFNWSLGVHRAPLKYEHPWLIVTEKGTYGAFTREEARRFWRAVSRGGDQRAG